MADGEEEAKKCPCPDCKFCQWCSDDRCRMCRGMKGSRGKKLSMAEQIELYQRINEGSKCAPAEEEGEDGVS